jgi:hypothetical protein
MIVYHQQVPVLPMLQHHPSHHQQKHILIDIIMAMKTSRRYVLTLYKQCLQCVQRIPDSGQRAMYQQYVRDRFRQRGNLSPFSREAYVAIRDAEDQLERMNYYHSLREQREKFHSKQQRQVPPILNLNNESSATFFVNKVSTALSSPPEPSLLNASAEPCLSIAVDPSSTTILSTSLEEAHTTKDDPIIILVQDWLLTQLPQLRTDDLQHYSQELVQLGFDSQDMLQHVELTEYDLKFMKVAHRRALLQRQDENVNNQRN